MLLVIKMETREYNRHFQLGQESLHKNKDMIQILEWLNQIN
jgi:hypothetical protein